MWLVVISTHAVLGGRTEIQTVLVGGVAVRGLLLMATRPFFHIPTYLPSPMRAIRERPKESKWEPNELLSIGGSWVTAPLRASEIRRVVCRFSLAEARQHQDRHLQDLERVCKNLSM